MRKKVLIVDDEPHVGRVFGIKLRLSGYDVITTTSGTDCIEIVRQQRPDIVLLDVLMPGISGFEVLEKVRSFSSVPVLMFTALPGVEEQASRLGANDLLTKPLDPARLVERVRSLLGEIGGPVSGCGIMINTTDPPNTAS